jgi:DNA helicase II / ATP-dependent DNA helicase PcrA
LAVFDKERLRARDLRADHALARDKGMVAVSKAASSQGFQIVAKPPGDPVLGTSDAKLLREWLSIYVRGDVSAEEQAVLAAHELGHLTLHQPHEQCTGEDMDAGGSRALARIEAYGPRERREIQANVFAREFLLPRSLAIALFIDEAQSATEIAAELGVPIGLVRRQLIDALLAPEAVLRESGKAKKLAPDQSQIDAANYSGTALLLEAGPGAGKTRTLIMRVDHLLETGQAKPVDIAALTFSQKAAGELSARLELVRPADSFEIWTGTFHAFGLDLIRRYYDRLNLPANVQLVDTVQAIELLEERLPLMGLKHYHDLRKPEEGLKKLLGAISRAKDELVDAPTFTARAREALFAAQTAEAIEAAERACETAQVYQLYTDTLRKAGALDFGDLIMLPTKLLSDDEAIRDQVSRRHRHVLVDEYQDVNRASARMLAELFRAGSKLWVVGDARQSLYRWRGASSANMARFEQDFAGGKRLPLGKNYRSTDHIVGLGRKFADGMTAGKAGLPYAATAERTEPGSQTRLLVGRDDRCEAMLLADEIEALLGAGVGLQNQAVLAPTNARLDIMAAVLAERGIATSHLGSFFEREEVRDVLAVLAVLAEPNGGALARLAALRGLAVRPHDIQIVVRAAVEADVALHAYLPHAPEIAGLSAGGATNLVRLGELIAGMTGYMPAFEAAAVWLFERSDYIRHLFAVEGAPGALARAAVLSLLRFLEQRELGGKPLTCDRVLKRMRSVMLLADDRDLRAATLGADVPAVRMMTVHGSKGLEFPAVHLVGLHEQCLPGKFRRDDLPLPPDLVEPETRETHMEEEECLFFVAISRAEDHLRLYHSEMANVQARKPSTFLKRLDALAGTKLAATTEASVLARRPLQGQATDEIDLFDVREHEQCPMRIVYRRHLGIHGRRHESPYLKTAGVLYQLVDRAAEIAGPGMETRMPELLEAIWLDRGPVESGLAADYLAHARQRAATLVGLANGFGAHGAARIEVPIAGGRLKMISPLVRTRGGLTEALFLDAGKTRSKSGNDLTAGLYLAAARHALGSGVTVFIGHVTDGATIPVQLKLERVSSDLETAGSILAHINAGTLAPSPKSHVCSRCPHFVTCPATGATA